MFFSLTGRQDVLAVLFQPGRPAVQCYAVVQKS